MVLINTKELKNVNLFELIPNKVYCGDCMSILAFLTVIVWHLNNDLIDSDSWIRMSYTSVYPDYPSLLDFMYAKSVTL